MARNSQKILSLVLVTIMVLPAVGIVTAKAAATTGKDARDRLPNGTMVGFEAAAAIPAAPTFPTAGVGRTYYVSPTGSNSNDGSLTSPWATPGFGSRQLHPGDTLIIRGGRYVLSQYDVDIIMPPSGNANAWITIMGEEGNRPVLAGRENLLTAIDLYAGDHASRDYIQIKNLEITSDKGAPFRDGIRGGEMNHVILKDLAIHHIDEFGVDVSDPKDLQILNCKMTYCGFGGIGGPAGVKGGWQNTLVDHCDLSYMGHYYQGGPGPSPYDRPDGFGIEPANGPVEIAHTTVTHNRGDGLDSKANNTYIHHCTVANGNADGIKLWGAGSKVVNTLIYGRGDGNTMTTPWAPIVVHGEPHTRFAIINVAVDDALGGNYLMYVNYDDPTNPIDLTVTNTIFSGRGENSPIFLGSGVSFTFRNNLFWMPKTDHVLDYGATSYTASQVERLGLGNKYGDPRYTSPAWGTTGNYHLKAGSPAIDAGTSVGAPPTDLDGKARPQGRSYDIGAYEYPGKYPTRLTAAAPAAVSVNQKFTVKGRLTANGAGLGYKTVILQRSTDNKVYKTLTTKGTNGTGWYQFSRNESKSGTYYYRIVYPGNGTNANSTSNVVKVAVSKIPTILNVTAPANAVIRKDFVIQGRLTSNLTKAGIPGQTIKLYRWNGSAWAYVNKNATTNATGWYSISRKETAIGTNRYLTKYAGTSTYAARNALAPVSVNLKEATPSTKVISFSGYEWTVKSSSEPVGPGPNYFSDSKDNVWVDGQGQLHLKITYSNGRWYCAEVVSARHFGYGQYRFYLSSRIDRINENAVLGLFTWDDNAAYHHREIDIEFSRWGQSSNDNAQFVVQPYTKASNIHRFDVTLLNSSSVQSFDWRATKISFLSLRGLYVPALEKGNSSVVASWVYNQSDIPVPGNENARLNLWLTNGAPPSDHKSVEVVVSKFEFNT